MLCKRRNLLHMVSMRTGTRVNHVADADGTQAWFNRTAQPARTAF